VAHLKNLFLLRHGKSLWNNASVSDFERTLNHRGIKDADNLGKYLARTNTVIDLILCSPATRTRQTLEEINSYLEPPPEIRFEDSLYGAHPESVLSLIANVPTEITSLLVIGHNPWIAELSYSLSPDGEIREQIEFGFPTCSLFRAELNSADWNLEQAVVVDVSFITPKQLKSL
jgi:phosphohistidine phosphatase